MKASPQGYRIAIVGASSLLGKELLNVLQERRFPFSYLATFSDDEDEPDLPILDLSEGPKTTLLNEKATASEFDFAFVAARSRQMPPFLNSTRNTGQGRSGCQVIDLSAASGVDETEQAACGKVVSIPFLEPLFLPRDSQSGRTKFLYVSPCPATIVISSLLLRLAARYPLEQAVAHVFTSASEIGSHGIEELQKQTVNLLSFQKIPRKVFGAQLAFNLLSRPGGTGGSELLALENRVRAQLTEYLQGKVPMPALRLLQVPVFHSLAVSLFVETQQPVAPEKAGESLLGQRVHMRRRSQESPTQVEVAGSDNIQVDSVTADPHYRNGLWIWAVADNLRLAAVNAVDLAGQLIVS